MTGCEQGVWAQGDVRCAGGPTQGDDARYAVGLSRGDVVGPAAAGCDPEGDDARTGEGEPTPAAVPPCGDARAREPLTPHELGRKGERCAAEYLVRHGWEVVERNWRTCFGEADLVVRDPVDPSSQVVLVEVKTRRVPRGSDVYPEEAFDSEKRRRYVAMTERYLQEHSETRSGRFDVISITDDGSETAHLRHYVHCERG